MTSAITTQMYVYISAAWVELDALTPARGFWGMTSNSPSARMADVGELTVALNNSAGLYSPGSATALSGWKKGLPFKMVVTFEGEDFVRFRGIIVDIKIKPANKDKKAYITVADWLDYAARHPIVNPGVQTDKRADEMITTILGDVEVAPQAQSIGTGTETFPIVFDTISGNVTSYSEIAKAAFSELGYAYVQKDRTNGETFVFEGSDARHGWVSPDTRSLTATVIDPDPGSLKLETDDYLLLETGDRLLLELADITAYTFDGTLDGTLITDFEAVYGEHVINRMGVTVNPRIIANGGFNPQTLVLPMLEDYQMASEDPTLNYDSEAFFGVGEWNAGSAIRRSIITPDFSTLPDGVVFHSAKLKLFPVSPDQSSNARTMHAHRVLRAAVNGGATWNTYNGTNNWGTAGCSNSTTDYDGAIEMGNMAVPASPTLNSALEMEFSEEGVEELQKMYDGTYDNRGIVLFVDQTDDLIYYASREEPNSNLHPQLVITFSRNILFKLDEEIIITPRNSFTLKGKYANPEGGNPIAGTSMITPVETTDYTMFSSTGGAGTDLTADLDVSISYGSEGFTAVLTNSNATYTGYVNKFNTRGAAIRRYNQIEHTEDDDTSIGLYGTEDERLNQAYKTTLYQAQGFIKTVVDEYKNPKTVLNSVSFVANKSDGCMLAFLYTDVGDMVYIDAPDIGVEANHYIQGVEFFINGGIANVKWTLLEYPSLQAGLSPIAVEFRGGSNTDALTYGVISRINSLTTQSYSFWIYADSIPSGADSDVIYYKYTSPGAVYISLYDSKLYFSHSFSTSGATWTTNASPFSTGAWNHVVITYNNTSTSNDPIIYINGSSVTVNETVAPVGSAVLQEAAEAFIGNAKNPSTGVYEYAMDGKLFDFRIYNTVISAGNVTTLYNSGDPDATLVTSGLIFQGFNVRTSEIASYTDITLTSSLKVRDNAYGAIGMANGSPIGRAAP